MEISIDRPVFLGAHPDDNCIGAGGIMSRLKGSEFHCVTFSCNNSMRDFEWKTAMKYLEPTSCRLLQLKGDSLPDNRYKIRERLERIKDRINPDVIFTHSLNSIHQSHLALAEETERIFRNVTILGHAGIKSGPRFVPNFFVELSRNEVDEKNKLISFHKSEGQKYFLQPEVIMAVARVNGAKIGVGYAEGFDVIRIKV